METLKGGDADIIINSNVFFVSDAGEIVEVINKFDKGLKVSTGVNNLFFLDPELPRWKKILES